jgi:vancomycin resistance protein VanW
VVRAVQRPRPCRRFAGDVGGVGGYPILLFEHSSKPIRRVPSELIQLQRNKVRNLELACARMDRLLLEPGDVFSFCALVGRTSRRRGYLDGLETHQGRIVGAPGGGLCQLANLLYWMALHLDLEIVERHHHAVDLFPDDERRVPFGMGATVFYNYRDLRFRNTLDQPLLLRVSVEDRLRGAFYSDRPVAFRIAIVEKAHRFRRDGSGAIVRENRVGKRIEYEDERPAFECEIAHNIGRVCYDPPEDQIEDGGQALRG